MSDNILSAVLTFSLLAGGTAAIGSEVFNTRSSAKAQVVVLPQVTVTGQRAAKLEIVTLPMVAIMGHREASTEVVTLPTVTVIGRRDTPTQVAVETQASEPRRVQ